MPYFALPRRQPIRLPLARCTLGMAALALLAGCISRPESPILEPAVGTVAAATATDLPSAAGLAQRHPDAARDEKAAWRALAPAWKVSLAGADPCSDAESQSLSCFHGSGSTLALIRQLGRPGIVSLRDESGAPVYALLVGLGEQSATLRFGTSTETLPIATLARLWRGDFATFWRVPPGYQNRIVDVDSGPAADWLAEHLAKLDGRAAPIDAAAFKASVAAFQVAQGLKADGLAGPTTFMQLNRAIGIDEPRLMSSAN